MRQRGFVLMAAIFLIVVFAAIGAYLVTIAIGQVEAASQDEQGTRAYLAARAGVDWAAYQLIRRPDVLPAPGAGDFGPTCSSAGAATATLTLDALGGPAGGDFFRVKVDCIRSTESEGGVAVEVFRVTSTGCNRSPCTAAGDAGYVERQLELVVAK
jgi:MSHA biogenesis protein MshP